MRHVFIVVQTYRLQSVRGELRFSINLDCKFEARLPRLLTQDNGGASLLLMRFMASYITNYDWFISRT